MGVTVVAPACLLLVLRMGRAAIGGQSRAGIGMLRTRSQRLVRQSGVGEKRLTVRMVTSVVALAREPTVCHMW